MKTTLALTIFLSVGICQQAGVQPAGNANGGVDSARAKSRDALALAAEFAIKNSAAQMRGYQLGVIDTHDLRNAQQSRVEAELRLAAFDVGLTSAPFGAAPNREEALRKCRLLLQEAVALAKADWDYTAAQVQLGAAPELELYAPRIRHARAESRLAAWDAGLLQFAVQSHAEDLPAPAPWPRSEIAIKKDILKTQEELRAPNSTELQTRRLELRLQGLQAEMDAASKQ